MNAAAPPQTTHARASNTNFFEYEEYTEDYVTGPPDAVRAAAKMIGLVQLDSLRKKENRRRARRATRVAHLVASASRAPVSFQQPSVPVIPQQPVSRAVGDLPPTDYSSLPSALDGAGDDDGADDGIDDGDDDDDDVSDTAPPTAAAAAAAAAAETTSRCGPATLPGSEAVADAAACAPASTHTDTRTNPFHCYGTNTSNESGGIADADADADADDASAASAASSSSNESASYSSSASVSASDIRAAMLQPGFIYEILQGARVQLWWTEAPATNHPEEVRLAATRAHVSAPRDTLGSPPEGTLCTPAAWDKVEIYQQSPLMVQILGGMRVCFAWYKHVMDILVSYTHLTQVAIARRITTAVREHTSKIFPSMPPPEHKDIFPYCWIRPSHQRDGDHDAGMEWAQSHHRIIPVYVLPFIVVLFSNPSDVNRDAQGDDAAAFCDTGAAGEGAAGKGEPDVPSDEPGDSSAAFSAQHTASFALAEKTTAACEDAAAEALAATDTAAETDRGNRGMSIRGFCGRVDQLVVVLSYHVSCSSGIEQKWRAMVHAQLQANMTMVRDTLFRRLAARTETLAIAVQQDRHHLTTLRRSVNGVIPFLRRQVGVLQQQTAGLPDLQRQLITLQQQNDRLRRRVERTQKRKSKAKERKGVKHKKSRTHN